MAFRLLTQSLFSLVNGRGRVPQFVLDDLQRTSWPWPRHQRRRINHSTRIHGVEDDLQILGPLLPGQGHPGRKPVGHADPSAVEDHQATERSQTLKELGARGVFPANVHVARGTPLDRRHQKERRRGPGKAILFPSLAVAYVVCGGCTKESLVDLDRGLDANLG